MVVYIYGSPQKISRLRRDFNTIIYYIMYLESIFGLVPAGGENFCGFEAHSSDFTVKTNVSKRFYH